MIYNIEPYRNIEITFEELEKVMKNLGFSSQVERTKEKWREEVLQRAVFFLVFSKAEKKLNYKIGYKAVDALVPKHSLVGLAHFLAVNNSLKKMDDLAHLIEKNRKTTQKNAA